jgi:hypothetical protein
MNRAERKYAKAIERLLQAARDAALAEQEAAEDRRRERQSLKLKIVGGDDE